MNPDVLLAHYDRISEAPDAIPRLRQFILDLAVRGKLVEQDPNDESASKLLEKIRNQKTDLANLKKAASRGDEKSKVEMEHPFDVPTKWAWSRLGGLSDKIHYGYTASADETIKAVRLLRITDIQGNAVNWETVPGCEISDKEIPNYKLENGDILIARTGGTIGKTFLVKDLPVVAVFASYLIRVKKVQEICDRYVKLFMESPLYWAQLRDGTRGAGQPNVNGQTLGQMLVPVPPLAEQYRIVTKVDELMALCDQLEKARKKREQTHDQLVAGCFQRLNQPNEDEEIFREDVGFTLCQLSRMTTRPEQIKQLRQTILSMAVRGKLVEQNPDDEPASVLLRTIQAFRDGLIEKRNIRRDQDVEYSTSMDVDLVPKEWCWVHVADIALVQGGKRLPNGAGFSQDPTPHIYIRVTDMKNGTVLDNNPAYISADVQKQISKYIINKEDLYITIAGTIGQVGKIPAALDGQNLTENAAKIVFRGMDPDFLLLTLTSEAVQTQFTEKTKQMAQPKLALKRICGAHLPLPPLAEQHRIVAKVDELMALCDQLEAQLTNTEFGSRRLLEAVLQEALGVAA
jgi:type I restriction enzyme, S subunit